MSDESDRIARNIQKMLSQGATDEDVTSYLASEGRSAPAAQSTPEKEVSDKGTLFNSVMRGATFDFADEAMGGIANMYAKIYDAISGNKSDITGEKGSGVTYESARDSVRDDQRGVAQRHPVLDTAAQVAGGLFTGGIGAHSALRGLKHAPKLIQRASVPAIAGAEGAAYGFGQGEGLEDSLIQARNQGAMSAVAAPIVNAAGQKMLKKIFPVKTSTGWHPVEKAAHELSEQQAPTRSLASIKMEADRFYNKAEKSGVRVTAGAYGNFKDKMNKMFETENITGRIYPPISGAIAELRSLQNPTYKQLEGIKKLLKRAKKSTNSDYARAARDIDTEPDDFIHALSSKDLQAGDATDLSSNLKKAKELWSRKAQTETIDTMEDKARRSEAFRQDNDFDKAIRDQIRPILNSPRKRYGMDPSVLNSLDDMLEGDRGKNIARTLAGIDPGSHTRRGFEVSIGAAAFGWAATGSPAGAILGVVPGMTGATAKRIANKMTKNEIDAIRYAILNKGKAEAKDIVTSILEPYSDVIAAGVAAGSAAGSDTADTSLDDLMR